MSDDERDDNRQAPSLASGTYGYSSTDGDPRSTQAGTTGTDGPEHDDLLSYETISETPLSASPSTQEENNSSQEIMPSNDPSEDETASADPITQPPAITQEEDGTEGNCLVFIFLIFLD